MAKRGKKFTEAAKLVDSTKFYNVKKQSSLRKKLAQQTLMQLLKLHSV